MILTEQPSVLLHSKSTKDRHVLYIYIHSFTLQNQVNHIQDGSERLGYGYHDLLHSIWTLPIHPLPHSGGGLEGQQEVTGIALPKINQSKEAVEQIASVLLCKDSRHLLLIPHIKKNNEPHVWTSF